MAEDTGGEAVAGEWYDRAAATYTTLIDVTHRVSSLYNLVNVPSGIWVNEEGRITRINEGTYSQVILNGLAGTDEYRVAVHDWVMSGADSPYVWSREQVRAKIRQRTPDEALAEPTFKLGVYFFERDNEPLARTYWERAQELFPDSWNFHRQNWSFTEDGSGGRQFMEKAQKTDLFGGDTPYYAPLDLPPPPDTPQKP